MTQKGKKNSDQLNWTEFCDLKLNKRIFEEIHKNIATRIFLFLIFSTWEIMIFRHHFIKY